tara:strand:- start:8251 stop:8475 length:225 start_codon:yes stop_codon:yes gene_type:complete
MNTAEKEAFKKAYRGCVAIASPEELSAFLDDYLKHDCNHDDLYNKYPDVYSNAVDCITLWDEAVKWAKENAKSP